MAIEEDAVEEVVKVVAVVVIIFSHKNFTLDLFSPREIFSSSRLEALRHPKRFRKVLPLIRVVSPFV